MKDAQQLIAAAKDFLDDLEDGVGVSFEIKPGAFQDFFTKVLKGEGGDLPIMIRIDPSVDTPKEE